MGLAAVIQVMIHVTSGNVPPDHANAIIGLFGNPAAPSALNISSTDTLLVQILHALVDHAGWNESIAINQRSLHSIYGVQQNSGWICGRKGSLIRRYEVGLPGLIPRQFVRDAVCKLLVIDCQPNVQELQEHRKMQGKKPMILVIDRNTNPRHFYNRFVPLIIIYKSEHSAIDLLLVNEGGSIIWIK